MPPTSWTLAALTGLLALTTAVRADDLVRVYLKTSPGALQHVLSSGLRTVLYRQGQFIDVVAPPDQAADLAGRYPCRTLQRDLDGFVRGLAARPGWGAYLTFPELRGRLRDWTVRWPGRVRLSTIGVGWDTQRRRADRPLLMATVGREAPGKPGVLLFGGIHAREIGTVDALVLAVEGLLERAPRDRPLAELLDSVVLHVVPLLNPDGRERVFGGDLWWRKNTRPDATGRPLGVDLNRNFDHHFGANLPQGGSSDVPTSETYRGPAAFSEPEARALRRLVLGHPDLVASVGLHGYGDLLVVPFGFDGRWPTPPDVYHRTALAMVRDVAYAVGTVHELLGYFSNGRLDDWLYGGREGGRGPVLAFQLEIGSTFFPEERELPRLAQQIESPILALCREAAAPPEVTARRRGAGRLQVTVRNRRLGALEDLTVVLEPRDGGDPVPCLTIESLAGALRGAGATEVTTEVALRGCSPDGGWLVASWRGGSRAGPVDGSSGQRADNRP